MGGSAQPPRTYIQVASGLNYLDQNGQWAEAQDLIELTWHSLIITFTPDGMTTACLDGNVLCRSTNSPPYYGWTDDRRLTLGHFDGDIDEVRISNKLRP